MVTHTKTSIYRSPRSERHREGTDGIVLIIVMMVATLLLIGLTATLPSVYQEGRREQEAELIFRGTQYARAVALFHKQLNRYPTSTKELLQTNGIRFLRQEYRDPLDREGKWRFIHVNAAGVLIDSKNQPLAGNCGNPAGIGQATSTNSTFGGTPRSGHLPWVRPRWAALRWEHRRSAPTPQAVPIPRIRSAARPSPTVFKEARPARPVFNRTRPVRLVRVNPADSRAKPAPVRLSLGTRMEFRAPSLQELLPRAATSPFEYGTSTIITMSGSSLALTWEASECKLACQPRRQGK